MVHSDCTTSRVHALSHFSQWGSLTQCATGQLNTSRDGAPNHILRPSHNTNTRDKVHSNLTTSRDGALSHFLQWGSLPQCATGQLNTSRDGAPNHILRPSHNTNTRDKVHSNLTTSRDGALSHFLQWGSLPQCETGQLNTSRNGAPNHILRRSH